MQKSTVLYVSVKSFIFTVQQTWDGHSCYCKFRTTTTLLLSYNLLISSLLLNVEMFTVFCTSTYTCPTAVHSTKVPCTTQYCSVLYCTGLPCPVLHCTALYCTALYCTALYCTTLNWSYIWFPVLHLQPVVQRWAGSKGLQNSVYEARVPGVHQTSNIAALSPLQTNYMLTSELIYRKLTYCASELIVFWPMQNPA